MGFLKKKLAQIWAPIYVNKEKKWIDNPVETQRFWFKKLIKEAENTEFGKDHSFSQIKNIQDFQEKVSVYDYENLNPYIERIKNGKNDILWPGKPLYFAKTSGTTSGTKYIPISKESMPFHIEGAKSSLLHYINKRKNAGCINGKMIFLQGSPVLKDVNGIKTGRLSGISAHFVPGYLQGNRMPSWETNCIEDWETKVDRIVDETVNRDMTLISGIPPWLVMYFEKLIERSGKSVGELYPNLQLLVTGGVNYKPYEKKIEELIGRKLDVIQTYPASEGFIGFQDDVDRNDLLLLANHGIFYEFIPSKELGKEKPQRLTLEEVELDTDYAIILTTNAGLWAYQIGDIVRFTSKDPYRIIISGRTKHYTSAFGEHVISYEVEEAIKEVIEQTDAVVQEFTLAPQVNPSEGLPYHEWFIEFEKVPSDMTDFSLKLDHALRKRNSYYDDLISGKILRPLKISTVQKNGFSNYMKEIGKLGGQNKLPRLSNDRSLANKLKKYVY
ncbi:MAG: GH3 auxin-responsive promoter family protein [Flavobacteriaceae bacterium]|jgi:hypothetical protein|nr:GH3 auxin-responsive promoter family protein [Flavobacteriaceae bacterium]